MFELKVIPHSEITTAILDEIIMIKSVAWHYSYEEQLKWINQNLNDNDLHFLIYQNNEIIAYANLVHVALLVDDKSISLIGIGNVCTKYPGEGHGKLLFTHINDYLSKNDLEGMLFCKTNLVTFYEKLQWTLHENLHPDESIETLTFNYKKRDGTCSYSDRLF